VIRRVSSANRTKSVLSGKSAKVRLTCNKAIACFFKKVCHRAFCDDLVLERCYVPYHVTTITKLFAHETPMFGGPAFFT
jgi:hypothetical protein